MSLVTDSTLGVKGVGFSPWEPLHPSQGFSVLQGGNSEVPRRTDGSDPVSPSGTAMLQETRLSEGLRGSQGS